MGRPGLLKNIANMYLMKDGTPFTSQPGWETMQLPDESRNRDGRFAQTVRTPGYKRVDDTAESAPNLAATMTGYQLVKYLTSAPICTVSTFLAILASRYRLWYSESCGKGNTVSLLDFCQVTSLSKCSMPKRKSCFRVADNTCILPLSCTGIAL